MNDAFIHFHTLELPDESNDIGIACISIVPFNLKEGERVFHIRLKVDGGDPNTLKWYANNGLDPLLNGVTGAGGAWTLASAYLNDNEIHRVFCHMPHIFRYKMSRLNRIWKPWQTIDIYSYLKGQGRDPVWPKWTTDHQSDCYVYTQYLKDPKLKDPTQLTLPEVFKAEEVSKKSKKKSKKKGKKK